MNFFQEGFSKQEKESAEILETPLDSNDSYVRDVWRRPEDRERLHEGSETIDSLVAKYGKALQKPLLPMKNSECCSEDTVKKDERSGVTEEERQTFLFAGTADANPRFGPGGGNQYFIQNIDDLLDSRKLYALESVVCNQKPDGSLPCMNRNLPSDITSRAGLDMRPISADDEMHLLESTSPQQREYGFTQEEEQYGSEWDCYPDDEAFLAEIQQLDENTIHEYGLTKAMPDGEQQRAEDYKHPHSDQESSQGVFMPDGFSNPKHIEEGSEWYQIRPADSQRNSPYFTDIVTVSRCMTKNGSVDLPKLLGMLQIKPRPDCDYVLTHFKYSSTGDHDSEV